ncbi:MAG: RNA methyltransferase [Magnetococcales bacterium]|nr:RNA methyltransferase [Magnetococcales bacterium]
MPIIDITDPDDPRLDPYRVLSRSCVQSSPSGFVAQGVNVVNRLLTSTLAIHSMMVVTNKIDQLTPQPAESVTLYRITKAILKSVAGTGYKSGVYAHAEQPKLLEIGTFLSSLASDEPITVLILSNSNNPRNIGAMIRSAAGLGAHGVILGDHSADPFHNQSVRASMGAVFGMPLIQCDDLKQGLIQLHQEGGFQLAATVLDAEATPLMQTKREQKRIGIVMGNEYNGLSQDCITQCQQKITLPMANETDSLNVTMAATLFLYHYRYLAT